MHYVRRSRKRLIKKFKCTRIVKCREIVGKAQKVNRVEARCKLEPQKGNEQRSE